MDSNEVNNHTAVPEPAGDRKRKRGGRGGGFAKGFICGIIVVLAVRLIVVPLVTGTKSPAVLLGERISASKDSAVNEESVGKLQQLEETINEYYYEPDEITKEQKEDGMYKGLIDSLDDPYSVYYTKDEVEALNENLSGQYYGIGAYISLDTASGYPKISGVIDNTPAQAAGLEADDIIYKVDDEDMGGRDLEEVVSLVRGEEGTTVHLTIARSGESDYLEFDVERAKVDSPTVESSMLDEENGIGYIQIAEFDDVTTSQFEEKLSSLEDEGLKGLVLDLRNNPGGNVDTVTAIAEYFLPEGLVFYMEDKDGKRTDYTTDGKKELGIPVAVLVNGNSASASEILSGAIQDAGSGTIIGTQTYGKGVVQTVLSLRDGTAVKLTIANYFTRNGNNINKKGITPDVELEFDSDAYREDGTDNQLERAQALVLEELQ